MRAVVLLGVGVLSLFVGHGMGLAEDRVVYEGKEGPGKGKHIVLVSGDEEYRSEEVCPQLGRILAEHHGFKCTVLFAIDPKDGTINPNVTTNIPGLETLKTADLMVIFTRFRNLSDEQMKHVAEYIDSGRPVVGIRTATHAFQVPGDRQYASYGNGAKDGGFGRRVLGEKWISHHGSHGKESTRGVIAPGQDAHPIVRGIAPGSIWGPSDVYGVTLPLPGDSTPVVLGEVLVGMKPTDPAVEGKKNTPMMPIAWTKTYTSASGKSSRVFTSTIGAATDFEAVGTRRLLLNGCYWALGLEAQIPAESKVDYVGEFKASPFKFGGHVKGVKPADLKWPK